MEKQLQQQQQKKTQPAGPTVEDQKEVLEKSKKWPMFYPNYINNQRTIAQGRKIPKSQCCANPTSLEIVHIANALKLPWVHERYKLYPRAFMLKPGQMMLPGRVRVQLWNEDKTPINEKIPTRTVGCTARTQQQSCLLEICVVHMYIACCTCILPADWALLKCCVCCVPLRRLWSLQVKTFQTLRLDTRESSMLKHKCKLTRLLLKRLRLRKAKRGRRAKKENGDNLLLYESEVHEHRSIIIASREHTCIERNILRLQLYVPLRFWRTRLLVISNCS